MFADTIAAAKSQFKGRDDPYQGALWFVLTLIAVGLLWSGTIRSDATPYGDGSRIMKWLSFVQSQDAWPTWNPYRNGGYPLFADPEQFWFLVPFVNSESVSANLQLNLALFVTLLLLVPPAWVFARRLQLAPMWAAAATVLVAFNENIIIAEQSGRFAAIIVLSSFCWLLAILARLRLNIGDYIGLSIATAVALILGLQYALPHALAIWSALVLSARSHGTLSWHAMFVATLKALGVGVAAVLLASAIILPVAGHFAEAHLPHGLKYEPLVNGGLAQLGRLVVPSVPGQPVFLTFVIVPAAILAIAMGYPRSVGHLLYKLRFLLVFLLCFLAMCLPYAGTLISALYERVPVLSTYRQLIGISGALAMLAPALCIAVMQHHGSILLGSLSLATRALISGYLCVAAVAIGMFQLSDMLPLRIAVIGALLILATLTFAARWSPGSRLTRQLSINSLGASLVVISIAHVAPMAFRETSQDSGKPLHVTNAVEQPKTQAIIRADPEPYFNIFKPDSTALWTLNSKHRSGAAFSLFFPRGFAYTLAYASPKFDISEQRPHWIGRVSCPDLDARALDLLGVKYLLCAKRDLDASFPSGFEVSPEGQETNGMVLVRRVANSPKALLHVFCRWRSLPLTAPQAADDLVLPAYDRGEVVVLPEHFPSPNGIFDEECPPSGIANAKYRFSGETANEMRLTVDALQAGLLVIPDNYASGWSATVNGKETTIELAFYAYRGVPIARGSNEIRLTFTDRYARLGIVLSTLSWSIALGLACLHFFLKRRTELSGSRRKSQGS